jgi:hypothetical protein
VYNYDKNALLATYVASIGLALLAVGVGLSSSISNRVSMRIGFLSIIATTRNPDLNRIAKGACLGAEGTMEELRKAKVRFGEIARFVIADREPGGHHTGFDLLDTGVGSVDYP